MQWGFAAGELVGAKDLVTALEPAAGSFAVWEITGVGPFAGRESLAVVRDAVASFSFRLTYHAAWRGVNLASPDPAARQRDVAQVMEQLRLARDLGASAVVAHPGERIRGLRDATAEERCRGSLRMLAAEGRDLGLELRVENMPRGPVELAQSASALQALVEPTTEAACWDVGHAKTWDGATELASIAPWVREIHLHDNGGGNDDHWPVTPSSTWVTPVLRQLDRPGLVATVEHRTVQECLASLRASRRLLEMGTREAGDVIG